MKYRNKDITRKRDDDLKPSLKMDLNQLGEQVISPLSLSLDVKGTEKTTEIIKKTKKIKQLPSPLYKSPIYLIEYPFLKKKRAELIQIGNVLRIGYKIQEGEKERVQYYEGLVIGKQNRGLGESFTLRRNVQGVGVEQIFPIHSPKILSLIKKQASKVRRAKLYFIRSLTGKAAKLRVKF